MDRSFDERPPQDGDTPERSDIGASSTLEPPQTFSISDLAQAFCVTTRAIRFYESQGLLTPTRRGATRVYSRRDRARLALILRGKRVGFSLGEIGEMLDLYDLRDGQAAQLRHALTKFDERIAALEAQRHEIDAALAELKEGRRLAAARLEEKSARRMAPPVTAFGVPARADQVSREGQIGEDFLGSGPVFEEG